MKVFLFVTCFLAVFLPCFSQAPVTLESRNGKYCTNDRFDQVGGWRDAKKACMQWFGTDLGSLHSTDEFREMKRFASRTLGSNVCIGLFRETTDGDYEWVDGSAYDWQIRRRKLDDLRDRNNGFTYYDVSDNKFYVRSDVGPCAPLCACPETFCCEWYDGPKNPWDTQCQGYTNEDDCLNRRENYNDYCSWHQCTSAGQCQALSSAPSPWPSTCSQFTSKYACLWEDPTTGVDRQEYCEWIESTVRAKDTELSKLEKNNQKKKNGNAVFMHHWYFTVLAVPISIALIAFVFGLAKLFKYQKYEQLP